MLRIGLRTNASKHARNAARLGVLLAATVLSGCMSTERPAPAATEQAAPANGGGPIQALIASLRNPPREPAAPAAAAPSVTNCGDTTAPAFTGRVITAGDSLAQGLTQVLRTKWTETAFTDVTRNSTGLARPDFFDTVGTFNSTIASAAQPGDIAVIWLGANDNQSLTNNDGSVAVYISHEEEWDAGYGARIAAMAQVCVSYRVDCYWLAPTASDPNDAEHVSHRARMGVIRGILISVASDPAYARYVHVVDVWSVRDEHPGWDFAHPGMAGFNEVAADISSDIARTKGVCMI